MRTLRCLAFISALIAVSPAIAQTSRNDSQIRAVLTHHMAAFQKRDADELIKGLRR